MQIPVDVKAIFDEATNVEAARNVPINVSVLLDENAPQDLVAYVRSSFASASPQARVSINYFCNQHIAFDAHSDMAVIAGGITNEVGAIAAHLRNCGIPTMVVTTMPTMVAELAEMSGAPIPAADIIAPQVKDGDVVMFAQPLEVSSHNVEEMSDTMAMEPFALEPFVMTPFFKEQMDARMGEWVATVFRGKRLAFAQAFDFVKKPLSLEAVRATSMQNAVVGFVAFIPGADLPIMTLNQAKMLLEIAAAYGYPMTTDRVKELAAVVGGGFACRGVARQAVGVVPALGWAVKAGVGYAGTQAMGRAAIEYFEHGGQVTGLLEAVDDARAKAVDAVERTRAGQAAANTATALGKQAKDATVRKVRQVAKTAPGKAVTLAKVVKNTAATAINESFRAGNSAL